MIIVDVHWASYAKHLRNKTHLQKFWKTGYDYTRMVVYATHWKNSKEKKNPKPLEQNSRDCFKLDDKHLHKELASKLINPYFFTDRLLKVAFKIK